MFLFRNVRLIQFEILILLSKIVARNGLVLSILPIFVPVVKMLSHISRKKRKLAEHFIATLSFLKMHWGT